jgi:hypothetical protein
MIIDIDKNVLITIVFIILFSVLLYVKKPELMFKNGEFKQFGTGKDQTLYPIWLVVMISSVVLYVFLISKSNKFV